MNCKIGAYFYFLDEKFRKDDYFKLYTLDYLKRFFINTLCINCFGNLSDEKLEDYYNNPLLAGLILSDIIKKIKLQKGKRELKSYLNALDKILA